MFMNKEIKNKAKKRRKYLYVIKEINQQIIE